MTCENCKCEKCVDSRIRTLGDVSLGSIIIIDNKLFSVYEHDYDTEGSFRKNVTILIRHVNKNERVTYISISPVERHGDWYEVKMPVEMP